jgi:sulfur carrier protein ThiS
MEVFVQKSGERLTVAHVGTAASLLEKLDVNPEVVLIVKDGELIAEDEDVSDASSIELLSVISGG